MEKTVLRKGQGWTLQAQLGQLNTGHCGNGFLLRICGAPTNLQGDKNRIEQTRIEYKREENGKAILRLLLKAELHFSQLIQAFEKSKRICIYLRNSLHSFKWSMATQ